jgi:hypothetical protein
MATLAGLAACAILALLTLNLVPLFHLSPVWQAIVVILMCSANFAFWRWNHIPPVSFRGAVKLCAWGLLLIGLLAAIDSLIGFAGGERSIVQAFIHSGPAGAPIDAFLFLSGVFIGVPTLVRSICLHYYGQRT